MTHHENNNKAITMPVYDFIGRLIKHIPDKNFRVIRYYNWLSNRQRGKLLPHVYQLLKQNPALIKKISWFTLFYNTFLLLLSLELICVLYVLLIGVLVYVCLLFV
ncbi:MAG: transposase, partial [Candidatus Pelagibacter sp.]|nr:transposase [Candidatus Pelagibacter sp.]